MPHTPEVLADLVARLRRDHSLQREFYGTPTAGEIYAANASNETHVLDRRDLELLVAPDNRCPPLEVDRFATLVLGWALGALPR